MANPNRTNNINKNISSAVKKLSQTIISNTKSSNNSSKSNKPTSSSVSNKAAGKKLGSNNRAFCGGYSYNYRSDKKSDFNPIRDGRVKGKMDEESRRFYHALTNKNSKYEIVKTSLSILNITISYYK